MVENNQRQMAEALQEEKREKLNSIYKPMTETVELPSGGIFYNSKASNVEIKPMSAKEEDILSNQKLIKSGRVFDELIKSCVINWNGIEWNELLIGDKSTIQMAIRIISFGEDYSVDFICPSCEKKSRRDVSLLQDMELKVLGKDPISPNANLFLWKSPKGIIFKYRLLTQKDQKEIEIENKKKKILLKENYKETKITDYLLHSIISVNDIEDKHEILSIISELMPADEIRALLKEINEVAPDYNKKYEFECNECMEVSEIDIPITVEFFWPKGRSNGQ